MSVNPKVDISEIEKAKEELLVIHANARRAHFATDANALFANHAESFIRVANGAIQHISREAIRQDFEQYFKNATYYEWDDLEPPIVQVSQDASMAWMITRTKVRRTQTDEAGVQREQEFVYAGIMTYEKQDGQWVRTANVSTFE
jgi:hypothetical protein